MYLWITSKAFGGSGWDLFVSRYGSDAWNIGWVIFSSSNLCFERLYFSCIHTEYVLMIQVLLFKHSNTIENVLWYNAICFPRCLALLSTKELSIHDVFLIQYYSVTDSDAISPEKHDAPTANNLLMTRYVFERSLSPAPRNKTAGFSRVIFRKPKSCQCALLLFVYGWIKNTTSTIFPFVLRIIRAHDMPRIIFHLGSS